MEATLTTRDIAVRLGVPQVTVRKLIAGGELKAIKNGNYWAVTGLDLEEFIKMHPRNPRGSRRTPL